MLSFIVITLLRMRQIVGVISGCLILAGYCQTLSGEVVLAVIPAKDDSFSCLHPHPFLVPFVLKKIAIRIGV